LTHPPNLCQNPLRTAKSLFHTYLIRSLISFQLVIGQGEKESPEVLPRLLEIGNNLQQMHEDTFIWWREKASEKIVARQIAARPEQLNLWPP
jgi:hypothetical protein